MDPNEQEADEKLIQAEEVDAAAEAAERQGNAEAASKLEEVVITLQEDGEQQKMDTESQINEANAKVRNRNQAQ